MPSPSRLVDAAAGTLIAASTAALFASVAAHSDYVGDDINNFFIARTRPFLEVLRTPIDVHFVPLYRLVTYALAWLAPMRHGVGLALLAVLWAVTLHATWRVLRHLVPVAWALPFVALFAANGCLHQVFVWFAAGLHRLPFLAASAWAVERFLVYRDAPTVRRAASVALLVVVALGFYSKALLIPLYLGGLEGVLSVRRGHSRNGRSLAFALFGLSVVAAVAQAALRPDFLGAPRIEPAFQLEFLGVSLMMTMGSLLGFVYTDERWQIAAIVAACALATIPLLRQGRKSGIAWLALTGLVFCNVFMVSALTNRINLFGMMIAWGSYRYYPEIAWVVVVFGAAAWGPYLEERAPEGPGRPAVAVAVVAVLAALHGVALWQRVRIEESTYVGFDQAHAYLKNLRAAVAREAPSKEKPLQLVDHPVPAYVMSWLGEQWPVSTVLTAMGTPFDEGKERRGAVTVDDTGNFVKAEPRRRKRR